MAIIGIQDDKTAQAEAASLKVAAQRGQACADVLFETIRANAKGWIPFLKDIAKMNDTERKGFREGVKNHLARMRKEHEFLKNDVQYPAVKKALATATTRASEMVGFSLACDSVLGFRPDWEMGYHFIISTSVLFRKSKAESGETAKGRTATPVMDKVKGYIVNLLKSGALTHAQLKDVETLVHTLASMNPKAVIAEAPKPPKAVVVAPAPGDRRVKQVSNVTAIRRATDVPNTAQAQVNEAANAAIERAAAAK